MEMRKTIAQSKSQLHADSSSNTLPGYKWTEGRIIPEDWKIKSLGELCSYQNGTSLERYFNNQEGYIVISIGNYSTEGNFVETGNYIDRIHSKTLNKFILNKNDLTMILNDKTSVGAIIGRVLLIEADNKYIFNQRTMRLTPKNQILPSFLYYQINCKRTHQDIVNKAKPGTQIYINTDDVIGLNVSLPASKHEQRAIAEALSDVDKLIEALEKLIAKKRAIKKSAMQQLLTGKTRLPGFSGEWRSCTLGNLGSFSKGRGIKRNDVSDDGVACVRYGELYTRYHDYIITPVSRISSLVAATALPIKTGDLLFAGSGETAEEIGRCAAYIGEEEAYAGGDIVVLSSTGQNSLYLSHLMNHETVVTQKARLGQGDAVVHISSRNLAQVKIELPPIAEQDAIATVLSDMDVELAALERRREKTKQIKQGMMQELLTGRIRLVKPSGEINHE